MGYMRHHAIVVTSYDEKLIELAHAAADELFPYVSPISPPSVNRYRSFFVPPDGSKEGWEASDHGDEARAFFISALNSLRWDDGSTSIDWVEVQYGDDEGESIVVNHSDALTTAPASPADA
jgi:hypothetical protein